MDERHTNATDISYCYERIKEASQMGDTTKKEGFLTSLLIIISLLLKLFYKSVVRHRF